ncbi:Gfo/Idh/MocA family oxidoreductase [Salinisphaera sp. SPP-AMP-43]|uniref:Gfo/Idh/MocA family protein n=1 Tax=Salinisphaera sp. SPP-AMP-43 TaxID=3121288 RepID=UPI003C6DFB7B
MTSNVIRVGFIGLNPDSHWAATAHMPALASLKDQFEVVGVANSSAESAQRSAEAYGLAHAFPDADALVASPEVDLVVVTVKVPHHHSLVTKALKAGKHVYCEWPLGNGLAEAEELADLARRQGVIAAIGTQARVAPEVLHLRRLIEDGFVGQVLSTSIIADGGHWADRTSADLAYLYDAANGATMLMIPFAHTLAALRDVLGDVEQFSADLSIRRPMVTIEDTGETFEKTAADEITATGRLVDGTALSMHYRGGLSHGTRLLWEIHGSEGDIRITGDNGHAQIVQLSLEGARAGDQARYSVMPPESDYTDLPDTSVARNVAGVYARIADDIANDTRTAPNFDEAVALHRILDNLTHSVHGK